MRYYLWIFGLIFFSVLHADTPKLHVCTVASKQKRQLSQLMKSAEYNGITVDVLGLGLPYKGNGQKLTYVKQYLDQFNDDEIVLFIDAYDALILGNKEKIIKAFLEFDYPCVFAAEIPLFPKSKVESLRKKFPESPTKFKYLNSGTYIGYVWALKNMVNGISIIENASDQGQIIPYYIKHQDEIKLDYYCDLFFALSRVDSKDFKIELEKKQVRCTVTDRVPSVIHGNGSKRYKAMYQKIYNKLFANEATQDQ